MANATRYDSSEYEPLGDLTHQHVEVTLGHIGFYDRVKVGFATRFVHPGGAASSCRVGLEQSPGC